MNETFKNLMIFYCMDAPAWARYAAVDSDGDLECYTTRPSQHDDVEDNTIGIWTNGHGSFFITHINMENINWKETLVELT